MCFWRFAPLPQGPSAGVVRSSQSEAVLYLENGLTKSYTDMAVQYVGRDICVKFGDSRLKPAEASFSAIFLTSITSNQK